MEVLDRYGIKATVAMDAATADNYPFIVQECQKRKWEFIGHGLTMQRIITSKMNEEQERDYIRTSLNSLQKATGVRPVGWLGGEFSESTRTPQLLAEEGVRYVCDWPNDEQPYKMKGQDAYFLPTLLELDDEYSMRAPRFLPVTEYCQMLQDAFDVVYHDSARSGRVLAFTLHPYLMGQPFRVKYLDLALAHMTKYGALWKATGKEIIDWYARKR
jgi:peptidoglycan/xylan/chitin deacetylase (PgdA/CDA1 family)